MNEEEELLPKSTKYSKYKMISLFEKKMDPKPSMEVVPLPPSRWTSEDPESIIDQPHFISQENVVYQTMGELRRQAEKLRKQKLKHQYYMHQFRVKTFAVLLSVQKIHKKPKEIDSNIQPLKWQRLKDLIKSLSSSIVLERKDAVKALKCLNCTNEEVISALHNTLQTDKDCAVQCETIKALLTLGSWDDDLMLKFVELLSESNGAPLEELIVILRKSLRDLAHKPRPQKLEFKGKEKLHLLLTALMTAPHTADMVPVHAAACLCYFNRKNQNATEYIMSYLHKGHTYQRKLALDVVTKYLGIHGTFPIQIILKQIQTSHIYKHRLRALDLLVVVGTQHIIQNNMYHPVINMLKKKLWDDPVVAVSRRVATILNLLGMKRTVWYDVEEQLEDNDALTRGRAVISLGILGLPNRKVIHTLLEMLETDISQYVRFQIIRTFAKLHLNNDQVKQSLLNRQLGGGPLAREAERVMKILEKKSIRQKTTLPAQKAF